MNYSSSCFSKLNYGADLLVTTDFGLEFFCQASQAFSAQAGGFSMAWQLCRICSISFMFKSFNLFLNSMFLIFDVFSNYGDMSNFSLNRCFFLSKWHFAGATSPSRGRAGAACFENLQFLLQWLNSAGEGFLYKKEIL